METLEDALRAERFGHSDDQELRATLNELCLRYAAELKERYSTKKEEDNV